MPIVLLQLVTKTMVLFSVSIPASISHCKMLSQLKATCRQNFGSQDSSGQVIWSLDNKKEMHLQVFFHIFYNSQCENKSSRIPISKLFNIVYNMFSNIVGNWYIYFSLFVEQIQIIFLALGTFWCYHDWFNIFLLFFHI